MLKISYPQLKNPGSIVINNTPGNNIIYDSSILKTTLNCSSVVQYCGRLVGNCSE